MGAGGRATWPSFWSGTRLLLRGRDVGPGPSARRAQKHLRVAVTWPLFSFLLGTKEAHTCTFRAHRFSLHSPAACRIRLVAAALASGGGDLKREKGPPCSSVLLVSS